MAQVVCEAGQDHLAQLIVRGLGSSDAKLAQVARVGEMLHKLQ